MLHAMYIKDGKASYKNKFVETEKLKTEKKFSRPFSFGFKYILDPYALFVQKLEKFLYGVDLKSSKTANTALVYHADKLLSLYESDVPYQINEKDLTTVRVFLIENRLGNLIFKASGSTASQRIQKLTQFQENYCFLITSHKISKIQVSLMEFAIRRGN
jgi:carotenoid cleavage dioxygenase-like enzyme